MLDLGLPDSGGLDTLRQTQAVMPGVPIVALTGLNDEAVAVRALREGAQDCLVKGQVDGNVLARSLRHAIERHRVHSTCRSLSLVDDLTGLHNRRGFLTLAEQHLKLACRLGKSFLLVFVDVDGLKQINDSFGHSEGNRALAETANVLRNSFRRSDILARLGGDEFAVLAADQSESSGEIVSHRLQDKIATCSTQPARLYRLSVSVGVVPWHPAQPYSLEELLAQADVLMYEQKRNPCAPGERSLLAK